jgi:hypothetical protein
MDWNTLSFDAFVSWLCERESQVIGWPLIWLCDPLSEWLTAVTGQVYGVEENRYGPARVDTCAWSYLPAWAQAFATYGDRYYYKRAMTGADALAVLAMLEARRGGYAALAR